MPLGPALRLTVLMVGCWDSPAACPAMVLLEMWTHDDQPCRESGVSPLPGDLALVPARRMRAHVRLQDGRLLEFEDAELADVREDGELYIVVRRGGEIVARFGWEDVRSWWGEERLEPPSTMR